MISRRDFLKIFDSRAGLLEVEAGIQWPELVDAYLAIQARSQPQWGFAQKQTCADRLSMAEGSLTSV
jgi:hypothetical protein